MICNIFSANEIDVDSRPEKPSEDKCQAAKLECNLLHCPYGVERYVDSDDCERCQCHDPCKGHSCPDGTQCAVDFYRNPQTGKTEFRGVCRPSELPQLDKHCKLYLLESPKIVSLPAVLIIIFIISVGIVHDNWL